MRKDYSVRVVNANIKVPSSSKRSGASPGGNQSSSALPNPQQNHLLDALPRIDYERVSEHLELLPLKLGDVLYESGALLRYVYFPTTAIISLLYVMVDGASAEIAIVGNEGLLGISLFMGGNTTRKSVV